MRTLLEMGLSNAALAAILALPVAAISRLCRRPALTHSLWLLVLLKLVTPPLVPLPSDWLPSWQPSLLPGEAVAAASEPSPRNNDDEAFATVIDFGPGEDTLPSRFSTTNPLAEELLGAPVDSTSGAQVDADLDPNKQETKSIAWRELLFVLWPAGSLLWFAWAVLHIRRFRRLLRHAKPGSAPLRDEVENLARRMGLRRCPTIWLVPGAVSPMVWTVGGRPRLLFPAKLLERLDREQRATLLTHELAHVRRRDHWVRALEVVVSGLYWWHPVVWWARRELHEAEEQCCDAWVVGTFEDAGRAYALALLQTVAFFSKVRSTLPLTASGIGQVPHLRRRLTMIMNGNTPRSLSWVGCLAVLGLAAMLLPLSAIHAQSAPPKDKEVDKSTSKDDRDQQIEILKKAIKILEEQKKTDSKDGSAPKEVDQEALKKLKRAVGELTGQIEEKRKELRDLEEKRNALLKDLGKLQGKSPTIELKMATGEDLKRSIIQGMKEAGGASELLKGALDKEMIKGALDSEIMKYKPSPEFQQKLERLLKDVEELKNELRKEFPKGTPTKPEKPLFKKQSDGEERNKPRDRSGATETAPATSASSAATAEPSSATTAAPASNRATTETAPRH